MGTENKIQYYYIHLKGDIPFPLYALKDMGVTEDTLVRAPNIEEWQRADNIEELSFLFADAQASEIDKDDKAISCSCSNNIEATVKRHSFPKLLLLGFITWCLWHLYLLIHSLIMNGGDIMDWGDVDYFWLLDRYTFDGQHITLEYYDFTEFLFFCGIPILGYIIHKKITSKYD